MSWTDDDKYFLSELVNAFNAMRDKRLTRKTYRNHRTGLCCSIGVLSKWRRLDPALLSDIISETLLDAVITENDKRPDETPEQRWQRMRNWVDEQLPHNFGKTASAHVPMGI